MPYKLPDGRLVTAEMSFELEVDGPAPAPNRVIELSDIQPVIDPETEEPTLHEDGSPQMELITRQVEVELQKPPARVKQFFPPNYLKYTTAEERAALGITWVEPE